MVDLSVNVSGILCERGDSMVGAIHTRHGGPRVDLLNLLHLVRVLFILGADDFHKQVVVFDRNE